MRSFLRYAIGLVVRNRRFCIPKNLADKDLLDIGCGWNMNPDFITVDYSWRNKLDICWDITRGLPLPDACVTGVFSEHCLEHLPLLAGDRVLSEIWRVLRPGGRVRLVVPDGELYMSRYVDWIRNGNQQKLPYSDTDFFEGIYQPIISVNRIFHGHGHAFIYDYAVLRDLLYHNGFVEIERAAFGEGKDERLLVDTPRRASESLYVEAIKPV